MGNDGGDQQRSRDDSTARSSRDQSRNRRNDKAHDDGQQQRPQHRARMDRSVSPDFEDVRQRKRNRIDGGETPYPSEQSVVSRRGAGTGALARQIRRAILNNVRGVPLTGVSSTTSHARSKAVRKPSIV